MAKTANASLLLHFAEREQHAEFGFCETERNECKLSGFECGRLMPASLVYFFF